ncbi:SNF2 family DNA or RNA helicase [Ruminiclostridium sufflavum DSM 19573]|uniref:SNF2 family DNA or RNA helicase n=1 Tax=Ruminiclostridium sufflavum DSM 19573 TaxID=1121337 RepID=A0A318XJJ5_9FIRM|nr:DEAD/DEAH box helicase [Ruminiclostridium sufflavum]PYG85009.1 SNF2 family DNA or RNA helicase [Ruminiclostridium sufflavum DSM 19573]
MFHISKESIYYLSTPMRFSKGLDYYTSKKVKSVSFNKNMLLFDASVIGNHPYNVQIQFDKKGYIKDYSCTCHDFSNTNSCCKHIISVLLLIIEKDNQGFFNSEKQKLAAKEIFDFFQARTSLSKIKINVEFSLELFKSKSPFAKIGPAAAFSMRIGTDRLYIVRNIREFLECIKSDKELIYGKGFSFDPSIFTFKDTEKKIISFLQEIWQNENLTDYLAGYTKKQSVLKDKEIFLSEAALKRLLVLLEPVAFNVILGEQKFEKICIVEKDIPLDFILTKNASAVELNIDTKAPLYQLTSDCEYFLYKDAIYRVSLNQQEYFKPFMHYISAQNTNLISFQDNDKERFFAELLPYIEKIGQVSIDEDLRAIVERVELEPEIYLDRHEDVITADVKFKYGERIINPFSAEVNQAPYDKILIRDLEKEGILLDILAETDCKVNGNRIYLDEEEKIFDFVNYVIPRLQEYSAVFYSESFKAMSFRRSLSFSGYLRLNSLTDLLEFNFNIDGVHKDELAYVIDSIKQKKKYYRLKNGDFLPLESTELINMAEIIDRLELNSSEFKNDIIQLPKYRALYIDNMLKESGMKFFERNNILKNLIHDMQEPSETEYKIPKAINGTLRSYQKLGFKWLKTLSVYGLGGILADDMGLGKTLQVITLLQYEKQVSGTCSSIVIVPTSLIYNWCSEVNKFAPEMTITAVVGSKPERLSLIESARKSDILVTSYALIRRDIDEYKKLSFRYCILDEAQHIKNPSSQAAKAVKQLVSSNRLALTGTPMENNLTELWSVFDFILPGYMHSHAKFVEKYEGPISKGDTSALSSLSKQLKPFILRRLKQDVLTELPDKIEHVIEAELTDDQKKLYMAYLEQAKGELFKEINENGFEKSQMKILAVLTRLRQLCCHPALFVDSYKGESGKLLLLKEIIEDSLMSGHRILIFSQFTSMLAIIKEWLISSETEYLYLDGSTPAEERIHLVRGFNSGKGKVFLLSLKSGGTGLNLTGADTVIHYDPWWNPAVEDQATDRAYRIGQTKTVHVMKLVTHGTIEEKIIKLKDRKKQLVDSVIQSGETLITKMSRQELEELFN